MIKWDIIRTLLFLLNPRKDHIIQALCTCVYFKKQCINSLQSNFWSFCCMAVSSALGLDSLKAPRFQVDSLRPTSCLSRCHCVCDSPGSLRWIWLTGRISLRHSSLLRTHTHAWSTLSSWAWTTEVTVFPGAKGKGQAASMVCCTCLKAQSEENIKTGQKIEMIKWKYCNKKTNELNTE